MNTYNLSTIDKLPLNSYGVIGFPVEHSLSPEIHNALSGKDNYYKILISPDELSDAIPILTQRMKGFNITIPHKLRIMDYLDIMDKSAISYGAVNTIKILKGKLYGYNTDGEGFLSAMKYAGINIKGKKILLIGAGGVARVIAYETIRAKSSLTIFCRNTDSGKFLADNIHKENNKAEIAVTDRLNNEKFDILINATPQGMFPNIGEMPVNEEFLSNISEVYDTIYNPIETKLLNAARQRGLKAQNGLYMLISQAAAARKIWTDDNYSETKINNIMNQLQAKLNK